MILYRHTGRAELALVEQSGWKAWPSRLPDQPIFYPVLTFDYAEKIARDWNSVRPAPDNLGFVTRFQVDDAISSKDPPQDAGGQSLRELWIPAEDLAEFNKQIIERIEVIARYRDGARLET